jgi:hypothetical protein
MARTLPVRAPAQGILSPYPLSRQDAVLILNKINPKAQVVKILCEFLASFLFN